MIEICSGCFSLTTDSSHSFLWQNKNEVSDAEDSLFILFSGRLERLRLETSRLCVLTDCGGKFTCSSVMKSLFNLTHTHTHTRSHLLIKLPKRPFSLLSSFSIVCCFAPTAKSPCVFSVLARHICSLQQQFRFNFDILSLISHRNDK